VDYAANTTWVAKPFGNIFEQSTGPYYTFFAGYSAVPAGGRIMMIPGSVYPENLTLSKVVRIEGWGRGFDDRPIDLGSVRNWRCPRRARGRLRFERPGSHSGSPALSHVR
jgi:hypothetical protein